MEMGNGDDKIRGELTCGMYERRRGGEKKKKRDVFPESSRI